MAAVAIPALLLATNLLTALLDLFTPMPFGPAHEAEIGVGTRLEWTGVAAPFMVEVADNENFDNALSLETSVNFTTLSDLWGSDERLPPGTYYWRVIAIDAANCSV